MTHRKKSKKLPPDDWVKEVIGRVGTRVEPKRWGEFFEPIQKTISQAYLRSRGLAPKIVTAKRELVVEAARTLSAMSVMAEEMEPEEMLTLQLRNDELAHFISYVRQLDKEYRALEGQVEVVNKRRTAEIEDHYRELERFKQRIATLEERERKTREEIEKDRGQKLYRDAIEGVGGAREGVGQALLGNQSSRYDTRGLPLIEGTGGGGDPGTESRVAKFLREHADRETKRIILARSIILTKPE